MKYAIKSVSVLLIFWVACASATAAFQNRDRVAAIDRAVKIAQNFKVSKSLDDFRSAMSAMNSTFDTSSLNSTNFVERRREQVRGWSEIIAAIEGAYQPGYDPFAFQNRPVNCIRIPAHLFCRRVDPSSIADAKARAEYVAALHANEAKEAREEQYRRIALLEDDATASLTLDLKIFGTLAKPGTPTDTSALDAIMRKSGLSGATRVLVEENSGILPSPTPEP